jgi:uncharacterized protein (TIGR00730 family)
MTQKTVTIFGTRKASEGDELWQLARDIGKACAQAGFAIANGGYTGTMEAAARGALEAGGHTIGVTCSAFGDGGLNPFIRQEVRCPALPDRLAKLIELGDAYVVLRGGTGTLLELAEVWELTNKRFLSPAKPIIITPGFWKPLVEMMAQDDPGCRDCLEFASTADDVARILRARLY